MNVKKIVILGGGTVSHVRNHLALCMPAYGSTARKLVQEILSDKRFDSMKPVLSLTKMADPIYGQIETFEDVELEVEKLIADLDVKIILFNIAIVDFAGSVQDKFGDTKSGKYEPRLSSSNEEERDIRLIPYQKILSRIRATRKDIFLVGFKTTCGATEDEQYLAALNLLKSSSCNLVLANDTKARRNMIVTPEEARYHVTTDRDEALTQLIDMTFYRSHLTFTRSTVIAGTPVPWSSSDVPSSLRAIVDYCISSDAYKPFRGGTVGHFACKLDDTNFLTSIRKSNFNDIYKLGLVHIQTDGPDTVLAYGARPSVGGQSQRIVFSEHPGLDCIVHFHCPKLPGSKVPTISQREYECGSHQCGQNTSNGLMEFGNLKAVYLDNHGPNIVFSKDIDPQEVIDFIKANFDLNAKTGGPVSINNSNKENK